MLSAVSISRLDAITITRLAPRAATSRSRWTAASLETGLLHQLVRNFSPTAPSRGNVKFADNPRGIPCREYTRREIAVNGRPSGHHGVIPDFTSWEYLHRMAQPDVGPDDHRSEFCRVVQVNAVMISVMYCHVRTNECVITDFDAAVRYDADPMVDKNSVANVQISSRPGRP